MRYEYFLVDFGQVTDIRMESYGCESIVQENPKRFYYNMSVCQARCKGSQPLTSKEKSDISPLIFQNCHKSPPIKYNGHSLTSAWSAGGKIAYKALAAHVEPYAYTFMMSASTGH